MRGKLIYTGSDELFTFIDAMAWIRCGGGKACRHLHLNKSTRFTDGINLRFSHPPGLFPSNAVRHTSGFSAGEQVCDVPDERFRNVSYTFPCILNAPLRSWRSSVLLYRVPVRWKCFKHSRESGR